MKMRFCGNCGKKVAGTVKIGREYWCNRCIRPEYSAESGREESEDEELEIEEDGYLDNAIRAIEGD